jgi:hypothetical protein
LKHTASGREIRQKGRKKCPLGVRHLRKKERKKEEKIKILQNSENI